MLTDIRKIRYTHRIDPHHAPSVWPHRVLSWRWEVGTIFRESSGSCWGGAASGGIDSDRSSSDEVSIVVRSSARLP